MGSSRDLCYNSRIRPFDGVGRARKGATRAIPGRGIGRKIMDVQIRLLEGEDIEPISAAFAAIGWNKPASQYARYLAEQEAGQRTVLVAFQEDAFVGYLTIR